VDEAEAVLTLLMTAGAELPTFASMFQRPAWQAEAACRGMGTALFFRDRGESTDEAKAVCARCPVQIECLSYSLDGDDRGIWSGTSERGRRAMRTRSA
jgi:WhiB family redox-sensing transcriptional regulator